MSKSTLVLLHGWGFSSQIWRPLIQALPDSVFDNICVIDLPGFGSAFHEPCQSLEQLLNSIAEQLPDQSFLCGWSLGGMLAIQLAARYPEKFTALVTIGSNLHFTEAENWPGMPEPDYREFCRRFSQQPEKTWQRFLGLQTRGDQRADIAATALTALADFSALQPETACNLLAILGEIDNRAAFSRLTLPGLHFLGEFDAITPSSIGSFLQDANTSQQIKTIAGASHALPIAYARQLADAITHWLSPTGNSINKSRIASSFSRAANSYDNAASLQRKIGTALLGALPAMHGNIIDVGCGTGFIAGELLKRNDNASNIIALDLAHGMLQRCRENFPSMLCVQADMEHLPLPDDYADWLVSSLALQWASDPAQCFQHWRNIIKPDGHLFFATFLPGTLRELQQSWSTVDNDVHVNPFTSKQCLLDALGSAGFTTVESVDATHTMYYPTLSTLAHELKAIGAHNMNGGQPAGLTGKNRWQAMQAAYELLRTDRGLPATYEVLYVSAS